MEYCGDVLSSEEAKKRSLAYEAHELKDAYIISLNANYFIDATQKGSLARFINHSCLPNCETRKWIVLGETRVGIFAKREISLGMELTYNYNFEWYGGATVRCLCGAANCSIFLGAKSQGFKEYNHVWEDGDTRYIVEDVPLYDSAEDESLPVISGTSGGNEHTKILNNSEESTSKLEPSNSTCKNYNIGSGSTTKKKSQRKPKLKRLKMGDPGWNYGKKLSEINKTAVVCKFCEKVTNGGIFRHKQHLIGAYRDVSRCKECPEVVREEIKKYVDEKKELKRQALLRSNATNPDDGEDEEMEEGEAADLSLPSKSQK